MRIPRLAVAATLVLAACGSGSDDTTAPASSSLRTEVRDADEGELFSELETSDVEASPDEDVVTSDPVTTEAAAATTSTTLAPDDGSSGGADTTTGDATGGGDTGGTSESTTSSTGGSTTGGATTGGTGSATTGGSATTSGAGDGGTAIDPDGDEEVCGLVREIRDAFDRLIDLDGPDAEVDLDDIRAALGDVARSLRAISSPATVAADAELLAQGVQLQIDEDLDGRELTEAEEDFLDGDELEDAGNRFDDFAVDACGVELF